MNQRLRCGPQLDTKRWRKETCWGGIHKIFTQLMICSTTRVRSGTSKPCSGFSMRVICRIRKIAVGGTGREDYLAWNYSKNGIFSVCSAYHLEVSLRISKKQYWRVHHQLQHNKGGMSHGVQGKAKIHVWRLWKNMLVVEAELHMHRINLGRGGCVTCRREETVLHQFLEASIC